MKKLLIIITVLFFALSCKNDDDTPSNPLSLLPPATMTGENTIGCLVNGEAFTDKGLMNNFYQFNNGRFILAINWEQDPAGDNSRSGSIVIRDIEIEEGKTYTLNISDYLEDLFTGGAGRYTSLKTLGQYETNSTYTGNITFTRFDTDANIMSGTFEFQAAEIFSGEIVTITDGRFDLKFTQ